MPSHCLSKVTKLPEALIDKWALVGLASRRHTSFRRCVCSSHLRSFRLQWTVRLETWRRWHFSKTTWHIEASGHLDYFGRAVWRHCMVLLCIFFTSESWSPSTTIVLEITATPFFLSKSSNDLWKKSFTWPSMSTRLSKKRLNFHFWVNDTFKIIVKTQSSLHP